MPTLTLRGATVNSAPSAFVHPIPQPHHTWADVAECAWLDVQVALGALESCERIIVEHEQRLIAARAWFSSRERTHPHWRAAEFRQAQIEHIQRGYEAVLPVRARWCWAACMRLFVALAQMTDAEKAAESAKIGLSSVPKSPTTIWLFVAGDRPQPGSWPTQDRDYWVEHQARRVELWNIPEMRELLGKWAA